MELFGNPINQCATQRISRKDRCSPLGKGKPDRAIIINRTVQVAADEPAKAISAALGKKEERQESQREYKQQRFKSERFCALPITKQFRKNSYNQQVRTNENCGERKLKDLLRGVNRHFK